MYMKLILTVLEHHSFMIKQSLLVSLNILAAMKSSQNHFLMEVKVNGIRILTVKVMILGGCRVCAESAL